MKMPSRPWYPPVKPKPDIFGLHHLTIIGAACERPEDRAKRVARVEEGVRAAFKAAVHHLGEDAARELFASLLRRGKRGRGTALSADRDERLLRAYDEASDDESVASISRRLWTHARELGSTPEAIARQMRVLVKARDQRNYRARVEARRLRMALRNAPRTLASGFTSSEK
jgi:hypothetical protein